MPVVTKDVIFLGNYADADTDESDRPVEDENIYRQNFGSAGDPLNNHIESVTFNDENNTSTTSTDNSNTADTVTTAAGTVELDSLAVVDGVVTYSDGSTQAYDDMVMFQTDDGNLYLANSDFAGTDIRGTGGLTIRSVDITTVVSTNYEGLYHENFQGFACYVSGTMIDTAGGPRRIDTLSVGDQVVTADHGLQTIRWIGQSDRVGFDAMVPVRIRADALGLGRPVHDLLVSQQHRMLVRSAIVERMSGSAQAFFSAKNLLPLCGVDLAPDLVVVRYFHILCDQHQVIYANGTPSETLLLGRQAQKMLGAKARAEVYDIFPELEHVQFNEPAACQIFPGRRQRRAVHRHIKNNRPILEQSQA